MSTKAGAARQRGLSLIELIIFMVIMGAAAGGILQLLNLSTRSSAEPLQRKQALMIAASLLEEVELAHFTYCDPADANADTATSVAGCASVAEAVGQETVDGVTNSRPYDNVNDYVSKFDEAQEAFLNPGGQLADAALVAFGGDATPLSGFKAHVRLSPVSTLGPTTPTDLTIPSGASGASMEVLQITVTVSYGSGYGSSVTLDGYRTRYAPGALP